MELRRPFQSPGARQLVRRDQRRTGHRALLSAAAIASRSNPQNDYESTVRHYPRLGIPYYLIADPRDGTCVRLWAVTTRQGVPGCDARVRYTFGDKITIGGRTIGTVSCRATAGTRTDGPRAPTPPSATQRHCASPSTRVTVRRPYPRPVPSSSVSPRTGIDRVRTAPGDSPGERSPESCPAAPTRGRNPPSRRCA